MGDVVGSALQEFVVMLRDAITQPGPWTAVGVVILVVVLAATLRNRISTAWVWIPALAGVAYFAVHRWLHL